MKISDEQAAKILTVGQAVEFVLASGAPTRSRRRPRAKAPTLSDAPSAAREQPRRSGWASCSTQLPEERRRAGVHALVVDRAALGLLRAAGVPRRQRARAGDHHAPVSRGSRPSASAPGRLTKIRAQAVSGRSCRAVAERLGVPDRLRAAAPPGAPPRVDALVAHRARAGVRDRGGDRGVLPRVRLRGDRRRRWSSAFAPEIEDALEHPVDFKSALQEHLARRGELVSYEVVDEQGPPHDRTFQVSGDRSAASSSAAARAAARRTPSRRPPRRRSRRWSMTA